MAKDFYKEWLDIPEDQRPPNHYQLLGVREFEDNPDAIQRAALEQYRRVEPYQGSEDAEDCTRMLRQIAQAEGVLRDPEKKRIYDKELFRQKDFYKEWLKIPEGQRPPNHYQLLGVRECEDDPEVIQKAALEQYSRVEPYQVSEDAEDCARMLRQIAQAEALLRDPEKKRIYDENLAQSQSALPYAHARERAGQTSDTTQPADQTAQRLPGLSDERVPTSVPSFAERLAGHIKTRPEAAAVVGLLMIGGFIFYSMSKGAPNEKPQVRKVAGVGLRPDTQLSKDFTNTIGMELVLIRAGQFMMGSPEDELSRSSAEGPQHRVRITKSFYIGKYEVTQEQYEAVMGDNPSHFKGPNNPVEKVSWNDAVEFCRKLSQKERREYGLPTEAAWEYACRAGTTTTFAFGETISTDQANYNGNYTYGGGKKGVFRQKTLPVGSLKANAWGLYDMHGNVFEWCADWYDEDYYKNSAPENPKGPSRGRDRVLRGGSWDDRPRGIRSANRNNCGPTLGGNNGGFRVVLRARGFR